MKKNIKITIGVIAGLILAGGAYYYFKPKMVKTDAGSPDVKPETPVTTSTAGSSMTAPAPVPSNSVVTSSNPPAPVVGDATLNKGEKTYAGVKESEIESFMASKFPSATVSKLMNHLRNGKVLRTDQYANMTLKEFSDAILKTQTVNGLFKTANFITPKGMVVGLLLGDAYNQKVISDQDKTTYFNLVRGM